MKALTLHQPWASLIAIGAKKVETRSWSTSYRGPLAIHAAARSPLHRIRTRWGTQVAGWNWSFYPGQRGRLWKDSGLQLTGLEHYTPAGAVVATCELVDVVPTETIYNDRSSYEGTSPGGGWLRHPSGAVVVTQPEIELGNYAAGRFAWLLDNVVALDEPVPASGMLGLWEWEPVAA